MTWLLKNRISLTPAMGVSSSRKKAAGARLPLLLLTPASVLVLGCGGGAGGVNR